MNGVETEKEAVTGYVERDGANSPSILTLPVELQRHILADALSEADVSPLALLRVCKSLSAIVLSVIYADVHVTSTKQAEALLDQAAATSRYCASYAQSCTFTLVGVPGGSTGGVRASTSVSVSQDKDENGDDRHRCKADRLWLASQVASTCNGGGRLRHMTFEMFGQRHSTLLTSSEYLDNVANAFCAAIAGAHNLRTLSWITPRVNHNFIGFSVAVVDSTFPPMIEGLQSAAVDLMPDGRRVALQKGSRQRRAHPLEQVTLHHCIFPLSAYANESFFLLFAQCHPDDADWLLFPRIRRIVIRTAVNVDPQSVAYLALIWQLRLDPSTKDMLLDVERLQWEQNPAWDPMIMLSDVFVNSIWGPRLDIDDIRRRITGLIDEGQKDVEGSGPATESPTSSASANVFLRTLEECSQTTGMRLSATWNDRIAKLHRWQIDQLIEAACKRVCIETTSDSIAGNL